MGRFVAILLLAFVGLVWFLFAGSVLRTALITGFGAGVMLPLVMNPTRYWQQAFWRCFDLVWAASFIGAAMAAYTAHVPRLAVLAPSLVSGLLFGTMASLGVGRSGLADVDR